MHYLTFEELQGLDSFLKRHYICTTSLDVCAMHKAICLWCDENKPERPLEWQSILEATLGSNSIYGERKI